MHRRVLALLVPLALIVSLVSVAPAVAAPPPVSLVGESLNASSTGTGSSTCTSVDGSSPGFRGSGSTTFNVSGPASGPFPGTFTAQGTITISADATTFAVNETFTITSPVGTVNGIKQGTAIPTGAYTTPTTGEVICIVDSISGLNSLAFYAHFVPWSATIHTLTETYADSGQSVPLVYTGRF